MTNGESRQSRSCTKQDSRLSWCSSAVDVANPPEVAESSGAGTKRGTRRTPTGDLACAAHSLWMSISVERVRNDRLVNFNSSDLVEKRCSVEQSLVPRGLKPRVVRARCV